MDPQELLRQSQLLFAEGKEKESIEAFTKALDAGADPYIVYLSRGVAHLKLNELEKSLDDFTKAIEANSQSARAYYFRGTAHMMKEEYESAVSDFTKALEYKTDHGMAKFSRAIAYARLNKSEEASRDMMGVIPEMEKNLQGFADSYGILRTEMWKVMAQMSGERPTPTLELNEKEMETLKKWLDDEK